MSTSLGYTDTSIRSPSVRLDSDVPFFSVPLLSVMSPHLCRSLPSRPEEPFVLETVTRRSPASGYRWRSRRPANLVRPGCYTSRVLSQSVGPKLWTETVNN